MVLDGLSPEKVFKYFEEICGIPHGSGNTKKISDYLVSFAKERNLKYIQDEYNNVIIYKDASCGYEASPVVIMQGHTDMVCEQTAGRNMDFLNEGLRLKKDGNIIYAEGTTLGGDDGIAVAYMLAVLDSDDVAHPALECVFTVDEEIGLLGAAALDCSALKGRIMLNIDSEEEGKLLVSCAGGATVECILPVQFENEAPTPDTVYCLKIDGVAGGHSGVEINKQGANAVKLLGRVLYALSADNDLRLIYLSGGNKDNAIPRTAYAYISIEKGDIRESLLSELEKTIRAEYAHTDSDIKISLCPPNMQMSEGKADETEYKYVMTKASTDKTLAALAGLPNGVMKYSQDIEGLVQTSLNLGVLKTDMSAKSISLSFSVRSSVGSEKSELISRMNCIMNGLGGTIKVSGEYPAWEFKKDSHLRDIMVLTYEELFNDKPQVLAIHAGLECGIFSGKMEGLDCVSFGPDVENIHTTEEKLHIDSVERTWKYILEVLKKLK